MLHAMKTSILFLLLLSPLPLLAGAPKKSVQNKYAALWVSSPFTTPAPPPPTIEGPKEDPLAEWSLGGVTKFPEGYFVILINKKKPEEKVIIQPGMHSEFKVLEVVDGGMDYTSTTVKLQHGSTQGVVTFDKKMLVIKPPPAAQVPKPQIVVPQLPTKTPQSSQGGNNEHQPRQRTIVPSHPNQPSSSGVQQGSSNGRQYNGPRIR
jgi:hypothetical protein